MSPKLWPEYEEIVNGAVNELEADNELFLEVLTTHRAMFGPEADSGNATEKFIAELLDNAPSLDIRALIVGETVVDWDNGYTRFEGTYTARELVQLLRKEELLVERGRDVYDDFLDSSEQYRKVTEDVFDGGVWEEIDLSNLLGANRRLREELASAQPHRVLPALEEHDAQAYEAVLNLEKPAVSNDFIDLVVETRDESFSEPFSLEALRRAKPAQVKPRVPLEPGAPAPDVVTDNTRRVVERTPQAPAPDVVAGTAGERALAGAQRESGMTPQAPAPDAVAGQDWYQSLERMRVTAEAEAFRISQEIRSRAGTLTLDEQATLYEEQQRAEQLAQQAAVGQQTLELLEDTREIVSPEQMTYEELQRFAGPAPSATSTREIVSPEQVTYEELQRFAGPAPKAAPLPDLAGRGSRFRAFDAGASTAPPVSAPEVATPDPNRGDRFAALSPEAQSAGQVRLTGADAETQRGQFRNQRAVAPPVSDGTPSPPGPPRLSAAQVRDANQTEVERLLAEQFGGFSFFLQRHRSELQVGLTADGQVVKADDPSAATVKNILDVIVDQGITAPTRVLGLLENTEWWSTTDARMREYDVLTADMSEPQKAEYLGPVLDLLRDEAQFLGFQLDNGRARDLAEQITRMGEETDSEYIRGLLTAEESFNAAEVTASSFAAARDEIMAMSKRYFTPINEADAAVFAQDIYVGTNTAEGVEQYFREMAANKMPQLANSLNAGITPEQYFAPYKYEIERMLDRPNVDLYEEFGDVVQYIPDTGTGEARPMTLGEVRKYVRGLDEWQQSSQGTDSARALSFSIGKLFGEVA